jgi:hypothetical protein
VSSAPFNLTNQDFTLGESPASGVVI